MHRTSAAPHRSTWLTAGTLAATLAASALTACGGGGGGGTPVTPAGQQLSVVISGNGTVSSQPSGLNCSSGTCEATYSTNAQVTLTAAPANGQVFAGWGGACTGTAATCAVTMSEARTVTAAFIAPPAAQQTLSLQISGSGTVASQPTGLNCNTPCSAPFATNTVVTLTPTPAGGQVFSAWGGACTGAGVTCNVTMSQARTVSATFVAQAPVQHALTVSLSGSGTVRSNPVGIDCGTTCSANFADGASVQLTATPDAGQQFSAWSGACTGSTATCTVAMTQARSTTATFTAAPDARAWQTAQLLEDSNNFNVQRVLSAIAPNGNAIVLWEQSDGVPNGDTRKFYSRRYVAGQGWEAAVTVPGATSANSTVSGFLVMDSAGTATWVRLNGETRRFNAATGWGAAFLPPAIAAGNVTAVALDTNANLTMVTGGNDVYANTLPVGATTWGAWVRVDNSGTLAATNSDIAFNSSRTAMAVWRERNPGDGNYSMRAARYLPGTGWQAPQTLDNSFDNVNSISPPRVAVDDAGNAIAVWHQADSLFVNVFSASSGWGTATEVDTGQVNAVFAARIDVAMASDGRAVVAWNSGIFAVKTMQYTPGAGFSAPVVAAPYGIERKMVLDDAGRTVMAYRSVDQWPNPTSATQNVYTRSLSWGGTWSAPALVETGAGDITSLEAMSFNRAGQGVAAWIQNDVANSSVRNSLWANVLR